MDLLDPADAGSGDQDTDDYSESSTCSQGHVHRQDRQRVYDFSDDEMEDIDQVTLEPRDVQISRDRRVDSTYDLLEILGKGKFGVVYKCMEKATSRYFAAKFIDIKHPQERKEVQTEIELMNDLRHPRLLQLYDAFDDGKRMTIIMELATGGELFSRVIDDQFVLTEKVCTVFMRQICEGVEYIHSKNVVHLDLKPENVLCVAPSSNRIKLIDFGLARRYSAKDSIRVMFGTPEFVAPEVINYDSISLATDMWSVGVICYILLSGLSPFMGDNDMETLSNVTNAAWDFEDECFDAISEDGKDFITQLLVKRPEKRITATQCLKHRWLKQSRRRSSIMDPEDKELSKAKLRHFVIRRRWQKIFNTVRALRRMGSFRLDSTIAGAENKDRCSPMDLVLAAGGVPDRIDEDVEPSAVAITIHDTNNQEVLDEGSAPEMQPNLDGITAPAEMLGEENVSDVTGEHTEGSRKNSVQDAHVASDTDSAAPPLDALTGHEVLGDMQPNEHLAVREEQRELVPMDTNIEKFAIVGSDAGSTGNSKEATPEHERRSLSSESSSLSVSSRSSEKREVRVANSISSLKRDSLSPEAKKSPTPEQDTKNGLPAKGGRSGSQRDSLSPDPRKSPSPDSKLTRMTSQFENSRNKFEERLSKSPSPAGSIGVSRSVSVNSFHLRSSPETDGKITSISTEVIEQKSRNVTISRSISKSPSPSGQRTGNPPANLAMFQKSPSPIASPKAKSPSPGISVTASTLLPTSSTKEFVVPITFVGDTDAEAERNEEQMLTSDANRKSSPGSRADSGAEDLLGSAPTTPDILDNDDVEDGSEAFVLDAAASVTAVEGNVVDNLSHTASTGADAMTTRPSVVPPSMQGERIIPIQIL